MVIGAVVDFQGLRVFVEAVSAGSLAGAGRRLRLSSMAATRSLAALEADLGVRLVHRTTRSLALTDDGQAFLAHAQALLEEEAAAYASVRASRDGASGLLRVTASAAFGRKIVAPLVTRFMAANPEVRVDLVLSDAILDVVAEGLDLAIRIARLNDSSLVARRLADSPRVLCAAPAYLAQRGAPALVADLRHHECLAGSGVTHWTFHSGGRETRARIGGRFTSNSIEGLHQACLGGLGIANLSAWEVYEELRAGTLVAVPLSDAVPEPLAVWAVYPTRRMVPQKVRAFIAALDEHLGALPRAMFNISG